MYLRRLKSRRFYCTAVKYFVALCILFLIVHNLLGNSETRASVPKNNKPVKPVEFIKNVKTDKSVSQGGQDPNPVINERREFVKQMMVDAWSNYKMYAWGYNELSPLTGQGWHGGKIFGEVNMGASIIDSLSTLYIMGLDQEFNEARNWIAENFNFKNTCAAVSLFETTIRFLGGFLSAFALSKDGIFLEKAVQVADALLPAFDTPHGIPYGWVTPCDKSVHGYTISLAALGSLHLEFAYLSAVTGSEVYVDKVERIRSRLKTILGKDGLYKNSVAISSGTFASDNTSVGPGADSFYEYLLKSWIQTGDLSARKMYDDTLDSMIKAGMFRVSLPSYLMYIGEADSDGKIAQDFSHLACFAGGMLALGAVTDPRNQTDFDGLSYGANITNTCHESYARSATGLGPEVFSMEPKFEAKSAWDMSSKYILRPEVIESYFYLWRITKDEKYREWAWDAARAIRKYCQVGWSGGFSGIVSVYYNWLLRPFLKDDMQQSFFLAETLKYLYLIFSTDDLIDLDYWVFNTEAHPLPILTKSIVFSARFNSTLTSKLGATRPENERSRWSRRRSRWALIQT